MTKEEFEAMLRKHWEETDGKAVDIKIAERELVFDIGAFISSLSYSKTPQEKLPV
jgi:hypothetical protein